MTTAIDTNVLIALWDHDPAISTAAQSALDNAQNKGALVVSGPVFAELMAAPGRTEAFSILSIATPALALNSIWTRQYGGRPARRSRGTRHVAGSNATLARGAS
jgi:predicted nucleic acid-binding protein